MSEIPPRPATTTELLEQILRELQRLNDQMALQNVAITSPTKARRKLASSLSVAEEEVTTIPEAVPSVLAALDAAPEHRPHLSIDELVTALSYSRQKITDALDYLAPIPGASYEAPRPARIAYGNAFSPKGNPHPGRPRKVYVAAKYRHNGQGQPLHPSKHRNIMYYRTDNEETGQIEEREVRWMTIPPRPTGPQSALSDEDPMIGHAG